MAAGVCAGSGGGGERDVEIAEPVDVESDIDCAEGGGGGAEGAAGVRGGNAAGIYRTARPRGEGIARDTGRDLHFAAGRVLCVSEHIGVSGARRGEVGVGRGGKIAAGSARGYCARRGVWDRRTHPRFLCDFEDGVGSWAGTHAEVFRGAVGAGPRHMNELSSAEAVCSRTAFFIGSCVGLASRISIAGTPKT